MEIHHGGYFDKQLDGSKKYKVARFSKTAGKIYLDGLDPELMSFIELNNIAYDLGYREKPISYHFKLPRTTCNEGWIPIKNDADALEMVKLIPPKSKQISLYITGGGRRKIREAELDDLRPVDPDHENPLNTMSAAEKERMFEEANLHAKQLNTCAVGVDEDGGPDLIELEDGAAEVGEGVNMGEVDMVGGDSSGINADQIATQSTFADLSDIIPDIFASQTSVFERDVGQSENSSQLQGQRGHSTVQQPVPKTYLARRIDISATAALNKKLALIQKRQREEALEKDREAWEKSEYEAAKKRQREACAGDSEMLERLEREEGEKKASEEAKKKASEEAEKREREIADERYREAFAAREELAAKFKEKSDASKLAKRPQDKGKRSVEAQKVNKSGRKPAEKRYKTRGKRSKQVEVVVDDDESDEGSDFYVDSDYDLDNDEFDDFEFEKNVTNPRVIEEFEDMGFRGYCSDEAGDSDELQDLNGSETEEDENGNPLPKKLKKGVKIIPWIRSVDLKNPKFKLGHAFPNSKYLKEGVREYGIKNQLGLWFKKNSKNKVQVSCQWECPFNLYASTEKDAGDTMIIRTLNNDHSCSPVDSSQWLTYNRFLTPLIDVLKDRVVSFFNCFQCNISVKNSIVFFLFLLTELHKRLLMTYWLMRIGLGREYTTIYRKSLIWWWGCRQSVERKEKQRE